MVHQDDLRTLNQDREWGLFNFGRVRANTDASSTIPSRISGASLGMTEKSSATYESDHQSVQHQSTGQALKIDFGPQAREGSASDLASQESADFNATSGQQLSHQKYLRERNLLFDRSSGAAAKRGKQGRGSDRTSPSKPTAGTGARQSEARSKLHGSTTASTTCDGIRTKYGRSQVADEAEDHGLIHLENRARLEQRKERLQRIEQKAMHMRDAAIDFEKASHHAAKKKGWLW